MSLLNILPAPPAIERVTTEQTDTLFNFRPGTVDDLSKELQTPKQQFAPPLDGMPGTDSPPVPPEASPAGLRREAGMAATQILDMTDGAMSFALSFIGKREAKNYRLSSNDKNIIRPHLAEYLKGKSVDIPPGFMLLFIVVMVYVPVVMRALADRKERHNEQPATNQEPPKEAPTPLIPNS